VSDSAFNLAVTQTAHLPKLVDFVAGAIVSKPLIDSPQIRQVLFAIDAGQCLSEHTSSFPATVHVLDGAMTMSVGGATHELRANDWLLMPAGAIHSVEATQPVRFILTLIKQPSKL